MLKIKAIDRGGGEHLVDAEADLSAMEILRDAGLPIEAACGGCCSCATCHVYIDESWIGKAGSRSEAEQELLIMSEHFREECSRLLCQIKMTESLDGLKVTLAPEE